MTSPGGRAFNATKPAAPNVLLSFDTPSRFIALVSGKP